jgi:hypothetical protein
MLPTLDRKQDAQNEFMYNYNIVNVKCLHQGYYQTSYCTLDQTGQPNVRVMMVLCSAWCDVVTAATLLYNGYTPYFYSPVRYHTPFVSLVTNVSYGT